VEWSHQLPTPPSTRGTGQLVSKARASVVDSPTVGQLVSARMSPSVPERPLSAPKTATVEKTATSTERSILLRIVGFVLT
jgi:hypothetical protein